MTRITLHSWPSGLKMRPVIRRMIVRLAWALSLLAVVAPTAAMAQSASPSPGAAKGPTVSGEVSGSLAKGSTLTISVDAAMPGGWEGLHLIEVFVRSGNQQLDEISFDIEDFKLTVGDQDIVVGTGSVATGAYLRVGGPDVVVTTGAGHLAFTVNADVVKTLPDTTRFDMSATTDRGDTVQATTKLSEPDGGGLTLGTVVTAVVIALVAGGFIGNLFASRRRPPPRASVYSSIQRKIQDESSASSRGA